MNRTNVRNSFYEKWLFNFLSILTRGLKRKTKVCKASLFFQFKPRVIDNNFSYFLSKSFWNISRHSSFIDLISWSILTRKKTFWSADNKNPIVLSTIQIITGLMITNRKRLASTSNTASALRNSFGARSIFNQTLQSNGKRGICFYTSAMCCSCDYDKRMKKFHSSISASEDF